MTAKEYFGPGFLLAYSDILFEANLLRSLINTGADVVLAIDNSYSYHKHKIDKHLDLVVSQKNYDASYRSLAPSSPTKLVRIGKGLELDKADYEFIGLAYFSEQGARRLREVHDQCLNNLAEPFHESPNFHRASITDMLQELIDRGFPVHGLEVHKGWMEIHRLEDIGIAEQEILVSHQGR